MDKLDNNAFRFSVGPWDGRYSPVWRIWSNPSLDDIYLGARSLLRCLKISLHQSGKFRAAYVKNYYDNVNESKKNNNGIDRAIMKWEKLPVLEK
jgi:hypothetical protein